MQANKEQTALIHAPIDQKVIGISAAGTGKTTTMLSRTKHILDTIHKGNVLLISFTRAAASDLKDRLQKTLTDFEMKRVEVGTFHSVLAKILRSHAIQIGLEDNFSIIDENSATSLYKSVMEKNDDFVKAAKEWLRFGQPPKTVYKELTKRDYTKLASIFSTFVNMTSFMELLEGNFSDETLIRFLKVEDKPNKKEYLSRLVPYFYDFFKESLLEARNTNTLTYDQILFLGNLTAYHGLLDSYKDNLAHMIVDEYQDTNQMQDYFVRIIGGDKLTIIGDVDQSIYEFRGGKVALMEDHSNEGLVLNLNQNYRSYQPILDAANKLIDHNTVGKTHRKPMLAAKALDEDYRGISYLVANNDFDEADSLIERVNYLHKKGVEYKDMAVLVRSRLQMTALNRALAQSKIPVNDTTSFGDLMKAEVVVDSLNFLKVYTNPKDIFAFLAVIDRPKRGIGPKALQKIEEAAKNRNMGLVEFVISPHIEDLTKGLKSKLEDFNRTYQDILSLKGSKSLRSLLEDIHTKTGYNDWIKGLKNKEKQETDKQLLYDLAETFELNYKAAHDGYNLYDLTTAFLFDSMTAMKEENKEGLVISTIHGAKGLEWNHVFLIGMTEGLFPSFRMQDNEDLEAERRLAYVAITRARESLTMSHSFSRIGMKDENLEPSRFLQDAGFTNKDARFV